MIGSNLTIEKIISRLAALGRPLLAPGQEYIGVGHEYNFICPQCGKTFRRKLDIALAKDKKCETCLECRYKNKSLSAESITKFLAKRRPHLKLVKFKSRKDIDILYPCGHIHTTSYNALRDYRKDMNICPKCQVEKIAEIQREISPLSKEEFQRRLTERYGNQFTVLERETRDHVSWIKVRCSCGHIRWTEAHNMVREISFPRIPLCIICSPCALHRLKSVGLSTISLLHICSIS